MTTKPLESTSQRIVKAVRKIAKAAQEEDGRLGIATPKAAIDKSRGVAFYNANGDMDSTDGAIPDDAKKDNESNDGSTTKSGESPLITDDLQEGDDAGEFKAYDCGTGQELNIDLAPVPGQEYPTPDGWDNWDSPPLPEYYESGYYWYFSGSAGTFRGHDPLSVAVAYNEAYWQQNYGYSTHSYDLTTIAFGGGAHGHGFAEYSFQTSGTGSQLKSATVWRQSCLDNHQSVCDSAPVSEWPADNKTDLALINGQFAASSYDGDAPQAYKDSPPSEIEVCDGLGRRYSITALEDGKSMITQVDFAGDVDPDGHSIIVGSDGVVSDRIGNAVRNSYLP